VHPVALHSRVACRLRIWTGLQRLVERRAEGAAVLAYHGVVAQQRDPLLDSYTVDAGTFRSHIRFFGEGREVVPLRKIVDRLTQGEPMPRHWVAVTLDDALANQVTTAAKILEEEGFPWALAVPAGLIETGRSIWTYELRFLLLECWPFPSVPWPVDEPRDLPTRSLAEKRAALRQLLPVLFNRVDDGQRAGYLERLIETVGQAEFRARMGADARFTLANWSQLRGLHASGVELLSHGWNHRPQNATIRREALVQEIADSRRLMGERLGELPAGFALPHGVKSKDTDALIDAAGYSFCLSSQPRRIMAGADPGNIPRFAAEYPLPVLRRHVLRH
jgi:peptidoglycan/xylan/chitin deacetylase (PgdA/CDA1 family)